MRDVFGRSFGWLVSAVGSCRICASDIPDDPDRTYRQKCRASVET